MNLPLDECVSMFLSSKLEGGKTGKKFLHCCLQEGPLPRTLGAIHFKVRGGSQERECIPLTLLVSSE